MWVFTDICLRSALNYITWSGDNSELNANKSPLLVNVWTVFSTFPRGLKLFQENSNVIETDRELRTQAKCLQKRELLFYLNTSAWENNNTKFGPGVIKDRQIEKTVHFWTPTIECRILHSPHTTNYSMNGWGSNFNPICASCWPIVTIQMFQILENSSRIDQRRCYLMGWENSPHKKMGLSRGKPIILGIQDNNRLL